MDERETLLFWSKELDIPLKNFRKPQVKKKKIEEIAYKGRFGKGTCNIFYGNAPFTNMVLMGIKRLQDNFK
ncbi:hypothetical protein L0Y46_05110 [bacterium]|nr:hypothetical protein [bacterium]